MTYSVITFPKSILCGKCGYPMRCDDQFNIGQPVVVRCYSANCEQRDIPLVFPAARTELQRASE